MVGRTQGKSCTLVGEQEAMESSKLFCLMALLMLLSLVVETTDRSTLVVDPIDDKDHRDSAVEWTDDSHVETVLVACD